MPLRNLVNTISNAISTNKQPVREAKLYRDLMRHEASIGGTVFGSVPEGRRREFFCLDEHTWVWHEEWTDKNGSRNVMTTRYDIRPTGVLKSQNGNHYQPVGDQESLRLLRAARLYYQKIREEIYTFA